MNKEEFIKEINNLNISITNDILDKLDAYYNYLYEYNKHTNLTAITNKEDVYLKHFYDSITLVKVIDLNSINNLLDIGSGAGFPGIVLKIFYPHLQVTLIDSNNKKTKFLTEVINKLQLDNIEVINDRVENFSKNNLNKYDLVTARAVTNLVVLTELAMPLVNVNKYFIALKANAENELNNSLYAIDYMHGSIEKIEKFELPFNAGVRTIIKIIKNKNTITTELRAYDKIIKKPLQKVDK